MTKEEKEFFNHRFDNLENTVIEHNKKLDENDELTKKLSVIVTGNGGKGHEQRIEELENKHKPIDQKTIIARRSLEVAIMGAILAALSFVAKLLGWI